MQFTKSRQTLAAPAPVIAAVGRGEQAMAQGSGSSIGSTGTEPCALANRSFDKHPSNTERTCKCSSSCHDFPRDRMPRTVCIYPRPPADEAAETMFYVSNMWRNSMIAEQTQVLG